MASRKKLRPAFTLAGFVLGISAAGFAISNAIVSLLVILRSVIVAGPGGPGLSLDLSSEIAIVISVGILMLGIFLVRGSFMIWRLAVMGGAINLAFGIILVIFSYAMTSVASNLLQPVFSLLFVENILMGWMAILSGTFGTAALFEQLQKRFTPLGVEEQNIVKISVALPNENIVQVSPRIDDTLIELRNKVRELAGKTVDGTTIIFRGKKITNESQTLRELGIREGDKITLV